MPRFIFRFATAYKNESKYEINTNKEKKSSFLDFFINITICITLGSKSDLRA